MLEPCSPSFSQRLLHPKYWVTWLGMGVSALLSLAPVSIRHALGRQLGSFIYRTNHKRRHIIECNLKHAFPELPEQERDEMGLSSMQWYGCALLDYSLLFFMSRSKLSANVDIKGAEHIDKAIAEGSNVVLLLAHSAMLDFAPAALGEEYTLYGSYKPVSNSVIDWMMARSRCKSVEFVISREEGMMKLVRVLKPGRVLIFLPDEDLGLKHGDFASFFGVQKATLNTPARIAKMKGAVSLPCYAWYNVKNNKYTINIGSPLEGFHSDDKAEGGRVLNQGLEELISLAPEQYMWLMTVYKTRPEGEGGLY